MDCAFALFSKLRTQAPINIAFSFNIYLVFNISFSGPVVSESAFGLAAHSISLDSWAQLKIMEKFEAPVWMATLDGLFPVSMCWIRPSLYKIYRSSTASPVKFHACLWHCWRSEKYFCLWITRLRSWINLVWF